MKPRDPRAVSIEFPEGRRLRPTRLRARRRAWWAISVVVFLAVSLLALQWAPPSSVPDDEGSISVIAPDFVLPTDGGATVSLSLFAGRAVVIHFVILVCCSYSALEIYYMKELEASVDGNVAFLSIALDSPYNYYSPEEFREIMEFNWTLALDSEGTVTKLYEAEETSTFVVDREGFIRYRDDKMTDAETLSAWLEKVI